MNLRALGDCPLLPALPPIIRLKINPEQDVHQCQSPQEKNPVRSRYWLTTTGVDSSGWFAATSADAKWAQ